jgi:hypothetical protein
MADNLYLKCFCADCGASLGASAAMAVLPASTDVRGTFWVTVSPPHVCGEKRVHDVVQLRAEVT